VKPKLKVTQKRSGSGKPDTQRRTLKGLGLRGPHSVVVVDNTPSFRGMIKKVIHLVAVEETNG
jgi:large subunit ribosomal protein L30